MKKPIALALAVLYICTLLGGCTQQAAVPQAHATQIFAHRGASGDYPENTIPAFQAAMDVKGLDGIELDVHLTKDDQIVVTHDETIDRVSNGTGAVKDYTLAQLKTFTFDNHMQGFDGVQLPTLQEVLDLIKPSTLLLNIEIKTGEYWYKDIEKKTVELVKENGMENRVIYSSFNHYSLKKVKELNPNAECGLLFSDVPLEVEKMAKNLKLEALHPANYHLLMSDFLKQYQESGLKLRVWRSNKPWSQQEADESKQFIAAGVDGIFTNYPQNLVEIRDAALATK